MKRLLVALSLISLACGKDTTTPTTLTPPVVGRWVLVGIQGQPLPAMTQITPTSNGKVAGGVIELSTDGNAQGWIVQFPSGSLGQDAVYNTITFTWTADGSTIQIKSAVATSGMGHVTIFPAATATAITKESMTIKWGAETYTYSWLPLSI